MVAGILAASAAMIATLVYCWVSLLLLLLLLLAAHGGGYDFIQEASTAPSESWYDYIVVGGGTAGCPLAATLSQRFRVLLLERGGAPFDNVNVTRAENFNRGLQDPSAAEHFVSEDGVSNHRARVLGGGSAINAGFYTRADRPFVAHHSWDEALVNDSYAWTERVVAFRPNLTSWQAALLQGLLQTGVTPFNGFTYDHIHGSKIGGTIFDSHGRRHTAADLLRYARPKRITVLLHATVTRLLFHHPPNAGEAPPAASAVAFMDELGREHVAYLDQKAGGDVIVSAGALGSPQLLMLSGIGPAAELRRLGITQLVEVPAVGQGMADNPMNGIFVTAPPGVHVGQSLIQVVGITSVGSFIETASFSSPPSFGLFQPLMAAQGWTQRQATTPCGFVLEKISGPRSRGWLRLVSADVRVAPAVRFNYFAEEADMERCVAGMQVVNDVVNSKALAPFRDVVNRTGPPQPRSAAEWAQYCRSTLMTIWHYHGGCQAGHVVHRGSLRVVGVDRLRVVDGSTFSSSPGTNPQATVMMMGRYMGIQILRERGYRPY